MRIRSDGSVQSHATPTYQNAGRKEDFGLYRCMVTKVVYCDDPSNITSNGSSPRVTYDVVVLGGFASGQVISNCRLATDLSGNDSYWERTLRAAEKNVSETRLTDSDGDIVYVQFIQGHTGYPVIIGCDQGIKTTGLIGTNKADGPRSVRQFNGVHEEINKDGELTIKVKGGTATAEKGSFKPAAAALVTTKTSKDEKVTVTFKSGLKIEEDGKNDKITTTWKGGLKIEQDGKSDKFTVTTKGGVIVTVDGTGGKVSIKKGATEILLDGNGDKISLKSGFVDLGSSVSDFAVLFTELLTAFNTHTHPFQYFAGPAPAAGVSMPPTAPMLQTVGSLTVKVQP